MGGGNELARLTDIPRRTLEKYLSGELDDLPSSRAASIANAAGVTVDWLVTGRGEPPRPRMGVSALRSTRAGGGPATPGLQEAGALWGDLVRVPVYDFRLSAGSGEPTWADEDPKDIIEVPKKLVRQFGMDPDSIVGFPVVGDSMAPSLNDGEVAFLDHSERDVRRDGIYALRRGDVLIVKRVLQRAVGGWLLRADNAAYGEEEVPKNELDEIHVLGRVGGAFRKM